MKRTSLLIVAMSLSSFMVSIPSEAIDVYAAARPLAPVVSSINKITQTSVSVNYKIDSAFKKRIKSVSYSINSGKSWKASKSSPIKIAGLKSATKYQIWLKQVSTAGKMIIVKKYFTTSAPAPVIEIPTIDFFTVQNLLWSDEFNSGTTINKSNWTARFCGHESENGGGTCHNNESQYYLPSAISVNNSGNAVITTTRVFSPPSQGTCLGSSCGYTSGRFDTQGKVSFQYGYIEARIKMPSGEGNWPAFWMIGDDIVDLGWPRSGEMDIAEQGGHQPNRNSAALHYSSTELGCCDHLYEYGEVFNSSNLSSDFHTYGLAWTPDQMTLYLDRVAFWSIDRYWIQSEFWPGNKPYFLILNNAVGPREGGFGGYWGNWSSSQMLIDYVRVFKLDGHGQVFK